MLYRCMLILCMVLCVVLSILLRMRIRARSRERNGAFVATPLSEAVSQTVGIAGGIYVAFSLLFGFLEISFPQKVQIAGVSLNPLAVWSMLLALIQPVLLAAWQCFVDKMYKN